MFVLDTNVVSELMRRAPDPVVASWVEKRTTSSLFLTAVTEAELRFGLAVMPMANAEPALRQPLNGCWNWALQIASYCLIAARLVPMPRLRPHDAG